MHMNLNKQGDAFSDHCFLSIVLAGFPIYGLLEEV